MLLSLPSLPFLLFYGLGSTLKVVSGGRLAPLSYISLPRTSEAYRRKPLLMGHKDVIYGMHDDFGKETLPVGTEAREAHNKLQADVFDEAARFFSSSEAVPPEVIPRLRRIIDATQVSEGSRVLDVGTGAGALLPYYLEKGVKESDVVGVDVSDEMLKVAHRRYPDATFWRRDIIDYDTTNQTRSFDAVVFNAVFGNIFDQRLALKKAAELTKIGGRVIISHPLGLQFLEELRRRSPLVVPNSIPAEEALRNLTFYLPFEVHSVINDPEFYISVLERIPTQRLERIFYLRGKVSNGYGRGSKKLGIPTANLPESQFSNHLQDIDAGVYLGWALVEGMEDPNLSIAKKAVVNIGYAPTFVGKEHREKIVEAHIIDGGFQGDFYDKEMRLLLLGFKRPEMKFSSFPELVATINQDVVHASDALSTPTFSELRFLELLRSMPTDVSFQSFPFVDQ